MSTLTEIQQYYDASVASRLGDFIDGNPRIEAAWKTVEHWAGESPHRILEIGCGIGDISWRMSLQWPDATVVGLDISPKELETARILFGCPKISFVEGPLTKNLLKEKFDLIVLMDVYEHIQSIDRAVLHEALKELLSDDCRVILTIPTPRHLEVLKREAPHLIQPVDEKVFPETILSLVNDLDQELLLYREVDVWHKGDYFHAVIGRRHGWIDAREMFIPIRKKIRRLVGNIYKKLTGRSHLIVKFRKSITLPNRTQRSALVRDKLNIVHTTEKL